jgi:hypothetical protein
LKQSQFNLCSRVDVKEELTIGAIGNAAGLHADLRPKYLPDRVNGRIIRVGVCTRNTPFQEGIYVPGCPPHPFHVKDFLANKGFETE